MSILLISLENLSYIRKDQTTLYLKRWNFNMCCARMEEWIGFKIGSPKVLTPSDWSMSKRKIKKPTCGSLLARNLLSSVRSPPQSLYLIDVQFPHA